MTLELTHDEQGQEWERIPFTAKGIFKWALFEKYKAPISFNGMGWLGNFDASGGLPTTPPQHKSAFRALLTILSTCTTRMEWMILQEERELPHESLHPRFRHRH